MPQIKAFIFDMDGTMIDSMPWHAKSWVEFARQHALQIGIDEIMKRTTGRTCTECMRELFDKPLSDAECEALTHQKESHYREMFGQNFVEVSGFCLFAATAAGRGIKLAVGTAGDRHNVKFVMARLPMNPAPLTIVGGDEGLTGKPTPAIFLEAARRIGVEPAACVVFEDAPFGIEAARRAGMHAVALCTSHSAAELAGPHVLAAAPDFQALLDADFLETLDVATA